MHNSISNIFGGHSDIDGSVDRAWETDRQPGRRLFWLFSLMLLPLLLVIGRLIYLQVFLPEMFVSQWEWTTETSESIPSRDGRILSADGTLLAYDTAHFGVWMHYRWLEEPAEKRWLRRKALARLDRTDRRNREKIEAAEQQVLAEREAMWQRLAQLAGVTRQELSQRRGDVQQRIERMLSHVERRREQREREAYSSSAEETLAVDAPWWQKTWQRVKTALTTPPRRGHRDPVSLPEQEEYYNLIEDVPFSVAAEIETHPRQYAGLLIRTMTDRNYPERSLAAHVIGARTRLDDEQWKRRRESYPQGDPLGYLPGDRIGTTGIERSYDRLLHGLRGQRRIVKDRRGEIIRNEIIRHPRAGGDIELTLHVPLQRRLEDLLDGAIAPSASADESNHGSNNGRQSAGGSIVVLDVRSGDLLAAVAAPRFDLDLLVHPDQQRWQQASSDPRRPFFPRVTRMTLPPGSVFKTLSAVALLESGKIDPDEAIECHGYYGDNPNRFRCYHSINHGPTTLSDALCRSCNVYFFSAADKIGPEQLVGWARRFGFGQPTGIDLPGERGGNLPLPPAQRRDNQGRQKPWYTGDTRGLAIGQAQLTVTPLQIARMMAIVANDGVLVTPHVVRAHDPLFVQSGDDSIEANNRSRPVPGLTGGTLQRVREGLARVVAHPSGTGYKRVRLEEITIAGKTGTAESGGNKGDHAWFAGYVPADQPRYAFVVVLEHAGSGGKVAGPVAKGLVQNLLAEGLLQTRQLTQRD